MMIETVSDHAMPTGHDWLVVEADEEVVAFVRESALGWDTLVPAARAARQLVDG